MRNPRRIRLIVLEWAGPENESRFDVRMGDLGELPHNADPSDPTLEVDRIADLRSTEERWHAALEHLAEAIAQSIVERGELRPCEGSCRPRPV